MSVWGWQPQRSQGIWRHGAVWLRPVTAAIPVLMILVLLEMFHFIGGALATGKGVLFDLPPGEMADGATTDFVAMVMPVKNETYVFYDDSRYLVGDGASLHSLQEQFAERIRLGGAKPLLVLADRRVNGGVLMELATAARRSGVPRILFAEKRPETVE